MSVNTKKITVSSVQIQNYFSNPIELLPAPLSGYVNNILGISERLIAGDTPFGDARVSTYYLNDAAAQQIFLGVIPMSASTSKSCYVQKNDLAQGLVITDQALYVRGSGDNTAGNSSLEIFVTYETKELD